MPPTDLRPFIHLRADGCSVVLDCRDERLPRILHWGADLGNLSNQMLATLALAQQGQRPSNSTDDPQQVSVLPENSAGWAGTPGVSGHRDGVAFSTMLHVSELNEHNNTLTVRAEDSDVGLTVDLKFELTPEGLIRQRATVTNTGPGAFQLDSVLLTFIVPNIATEILDLTGRHTRERSPQRSPLNFGTHLRENRTGRTGMDSPLVLIAGEAAFNFASGQVWGLHTAWSGNHQHLVEKSSRGISLLGGGELLLPGEGRLGEGENYRTPWVYGSYGVGLDQMSHRFHRHLRARAGYPTRPRPVTMNTWEAVYFKQNLHDLSALADAAAEVGAERFVLDDGWFNHRRSDNAGLGDWYVDESVWPSGLQPLIDHVVGAGMEFGLWVEPEMINPDSDLARAHPEWILAPGSRLPMSARRQQVLDLGNPQAYHYIWERLTALLDEYAISYLKWDHNRDLIEAGHQATGTAGVHDQTLAVYRMIDELKARYPHLEIESCSGGGGRVDLGILARTDRIWTSDCIDALERQQIQRWTSLLVPIEIQGSHVGSPTSHTTGRRHTLAFRAGTALFGHFGIEWDLTKATTPERVELARWVDLYKQLRPLLGSGTLVRGDHPDPALWVTGVVAADRSHAVFALAQLATSVQAPAGRVRLPGLKPDAQYKVSPLPPGDVISGPGESALAWWTEDLVLTGKLLETVGLAAPTQHPESLVLIQVRQI